MIFLRSGLVSEAPETWSTELFEPYVKVNYQKRQTKIKI